MRPSPRYALSLLAFAAPAISSCDGITTGQLSDPPGPPILQKILIQDEAPTGGRNVATDLLDQTPTVACSERVPCLTGDKFSHPPCDLDAGVCPDPLKPSQTPPAIGTPKSLGGNMIRIVFDKLLDPAIESESINPITGQIGGYALADPSIIGVYDDKGNELPSLKYWDPIGSPTLTSDLFQNPHGPALVLKPNGAFLPLASYSIRIKPELIKDRQGRAVAKDINGAPVATSYPFTMEGFHAAGGALVDINPPTGGAIDVKDVLAIKTTARFDPASLKVTVKQNGNIIETVAAPEFGADPKHCASAAASPLQINIFRVTGEDRTDWDEGDYTVSISAVAIDDRSALFSIDPFGKIPYADVPFKVKAGIDKDKLYLAEMLLLPWECAAAGPPDMSGAGDLAMARDMATPPDMAVSVDDLATPADQAAPADLSKSPVDGGAVDMAKKLDGGGDMAKPVDARVGG